MNENTVFISFFINLELQEKVTPRLHFNIINKYLCIHVFVKSFFPQCYLFYASLAKDLLTYPLLIHQGVPE